MENTNEKEDLQLAFKGILEERSKECQETGRSKESITIGCIGKSKSGKSTFINSLSAIPDVLQRLAISSDNRTKVTVKYVFRQEDQGKKIVLREIELKPELKLSEVPKSALAALYGEELSEEELCDEKFIDKLRERLEERTGKPIDIDELAKLINTPEMDQVVQKLVIETPPNDELWAYLVKRSLKELCVVDSRGINDVDDKEESGKEREKAFGAPLAERGLDGLDVLLFFAFGDAQSNMESEIYGKFLKQITEAIPVFSVAREPSNSIWDNCKNKLNCDTIGSMDGTREMIKTYQSECGKALKNLNWNLYDELTKQGVMTKQNGSYSYTNGYCPIEKTAFLLPLLETFRGFAGEPSELEEACQTPEYKDYALMASAITVKMAEEYFWFWRQMNEVFQSKLLPGLFWAEANDGALKGVAEDIKHYDDYYSRDDIFYMRPKSREYLLSKLEGRLINGDILGPRGGITDCYHTGLAAVTTYHCVYNTINSMMEELKKGGILDDIDLEVDGDARIHLIDKCVKNTLYRRTDGCCFRRWSMYDRYELQWMIEKLREKWPEISAKNSSIRFFYLLIYGMLLDHCNEINKSKPE